MNILMLACTREGEANMERLTSLFQNDEVTCRSFYHKSPDDLGLYDVVRRQFAKVDALIFFCAAGIAVRAIAPVISDKWSDPAVLVLGEKADFCIPILSGHMGGANELAARCAKYLGATAVVTTATDGNGLFSVDDFARENHLALADHDGAKAISVAVLEGARVQVTNEFSELPLSGLPLSDLPLSGLSDREEMAETKIKRVCVSCYERPGYDLMLYPKILSLGIGCKRETAASQIEKVVFEALGAAGLSIHSVSSIASITLKQEEEGLLSFAEKMNLPIHFYTAEQLSQLEGDFSQSKFVEEVTGVSNVCERSAVLSSMAGGTGGRLLMKKYSSGGVTVAAALTI